MYDSANKIVDEAFNYTDTISYDREKKPFDILDNKIQSSGLSR
jgi:hypothetical protein